MNIVYVTDKAVNPESGGIARITYVMSEALRKIYGYSVYSYYGQEDFRNYIQKLGSCIVIIQSPSKLAPKILLSIRDVEHIKTINVFHGTPGYELVPLEREIISYHLRHNIERKWTIKQLLLQIGMSILPKKFYYHILRKKYALPYGKADKIVVLSKGIIDQYLSIAPGNREQFVAIPNALSFNHIEHDLSKCKEVLVVTRLDDWHKRILEILKIWDTLQKDASFADWTLRIVGDGLDKAYYEDFVRREKVVNVTFEGQQNPLPYYQKAAIFMMTSACEGLPMTILEAQQCGCVPILYDSFASAKDVVTDGENGFLIPYRDRTAYIAALQRLMSDSDLRKRMSEACVRSSERYSVENVAAKWNELFSL